MSKRFRAANAAARGTSAPLARPLKAVSSDCSRNNDRKETSTSLNCPRCVILRADDEGTKVVVGWKEGLVASKPPSITKPPTEAVDVVPVEVRIAPETQKALGLSRKTQKRHVFLPLCLLGPLGGHGAAEAYHNIELTANSPADTHDPRHEEEPTMPPTAGDTRPLRQSLLEALKQAVCRALKWRVNSCYGAPMQLVARVAKPKMASPPTMQPSDQAVSQTSDQHAAVGQASEVIEGDPTPPSLPLNSDEEVLRVLQEHYGPLLTKYDRHAHASACSSKANNSAALSSDESSNDGTMNSAEWASCISVLRILRLPRGPRLSLELQIKPSLPDLSFAMNEATVLIPPPPPLGEMKAPKGPTYSDNENPPPYQLLSLYKFFPVKSPSAFAELLRALWGPRGVLGRVYVAPEGFNAQVAAPSVVLPCMTSEMERIPGLTSGLQVTLDCLVPFDQYWKTPPFDALHIRTRQQVLRDGFDAPLNWEDCGEEVEPAIWHRKVREMLQQQQQQQSQQQQQEQPQQQQKRKLVLLDMRNASEYAVGHFKGAERVDTPTFADSFSPGGPLEAALLRAGVKLPHGRDSCVPGSRCSSSGEDVEVMMYCTGGIRCVKAGAFVRQVLGIPRVTRLKGGILAYKNFVKNLRGESLTDIGELAELDAGPSAPRHFAPAASPLSRDAGFTIVGKQEEQTGGGPSATEGQASVPESLFVGSNYVFDHRMCQEVTADMLAQCDLCNGPTGRLSNCSNRSCGRRMAICASCCSSIGIYCSSACAEEGARQKDRDNHARRQRRMQARYTHNRFMQQRGLWATRAQQLLAALKHGTATNIPPRMPDFRGSVEDSLSRDPREDWREWSHRVAADASSPSALHAALLEQGRQTAESLTGIGKDGPQFWSGHLQSSILSAISRLQRPRSILEIGAFVGISSLALAEGLACGEAERKDCIGLFAIEQDPRAASAARNLVNASPWSSLIHVIEADALELLRSSTAGSGKILDGPSSPEGMRVFRPPERGFDLIYLDAEKRRYAEYVRIILNPQRPLLAPEGALVIDNTLWHRGQDGRRPSWWSEFDTEGDSAKAKRYNRISEDMKALRDALRKDSRILHVLLPVGDGLSIVTWAKQEPPLKTY
ncbi:uncharacterized protein LOC34618814 [Cyclospora cayetanensis]|uniref:Uncharacterized protein LOC34618814 n=1 Tax=Cyclospora cayetanensis TaxID=88456 RepID=A0A6P6RXA0_9EIME|nr:uncharacterized protein LOC34618814 [Cyclospora cayetanensis]